MKRLLLLLLALPGLAQDGDRQIDWVGDWNEAFRQAKDTGRPVMVCINSKDGEPASDRAAKDTYRDPGFVAKTRDFVMVVISTQSHWPLGKCRRFGKVTCEEHLNCWKALRAAHGEQFMASSMSGTMISPQHAWFRPDGTLLRRKEYELTKAELLERMQRVLDEIAGKSDAPESGGEPEAGAEPEPAPESKDAPLTDKDKAELQRAQTAADKESRRAALGNLLATEKIAAHVAIVDLLQTTKDSKLKCDILRSLGRASVADARIAIEECLADKDEVVRSFAAVALEELGQADSVPALLKRAKRERDMYARKNMYRAAGACGGPVADKTAAKALLKALKSDKQNAVKKHAALACRSFRSEEATKLVLKKLETALQRVKDPWVRGAVAYTLAYIGNEKTTLPLFQKMRDDSNIDYVKSFYRNAIRVLRKESSEFGRSAYFLFSEDRDDPAREE